MKIPYNWLKNYLDIDLPPKEAARILTMAGHALDKPLFDQAGDTIMDLEDRGNRSDVTGIIGIARDLAALTNKTLTFPKLSPLPEVDNAKMPIKIKVETDKVLRWTAIVYKNIKIGESPKWIQERLASYGMESINNIVDITNYVMIELGMPLHAFDLDKVDEIVLRQAKNGEKLITFEGTELKLDSSDIVAADSHAPVALATAVGGKTSGISANTVNTLIESGLYDQPSARRSAINHNVRNETSNRLGKYLHPDYCEISLKRVAQLMKDVLNAEPETVSFDYYPSKKEQAVVELSQAKLDLLTGEHVSLNFAKEALEKLGFLINGVHDNKLSVTVPYYRTDVSIEEDLIEEVLRIKGYESIPPSMPALPAPAKLKFLEMELEDRIRDVIVRLGFDEVISLQIVDKARLEALGLPMSNSVALENSWNQELNVMRTELTTSLLNYFSSYTKHKVEDIRLFEVGKTYSKDDSKKGYEKYTENRMVGLIISGGYLELKGYVERLLEDLGIESVEFAAGEHPLYKQTISARILKNGKELGKIGEIKQKIMVSEGLSAKAASCELNILELVKLAQPFNFKVSTSIQNYMTEDITITVSEHEPTGTLLTKITTGLDTNSSVTLKQIYQDQTLKTQGKKNLTISIKALNEKSLETIKEKIRVKYN